MSAGGLPSASALSTWRTPLVIIACGCAIALLSFGPRSSFGFFIQPMSREFTWGRDVFGIALGAGTAAGSFGQFLFAPFGVAMIDNFGWQTALMVFAALMLLIVPLSLALRTPPATTADVPAADQQSFMTALAEAFGHRSYVLLVLGFFTCGFQLAFITVHLPAYLVDR